MVLMMGLMMAPMMVLMMGNDGGVACSSQEGGPREGRGRWHILQDGSRRVGGGVAVAEQRTRDAFNGRVWGLVRKRKDFTVQIQNVEGI